MWIDLAIVLGYFVVVMFFALRGREGDVESKEAYFLSNRNLSWHSVAISTIATNVQGYQFLGMMGSAYLYGIAQASLEINAVQGILFAAFVFVPMYLSQRVITITQWIKSKLGEWVALAYSLANIALFSTIGLGAALFWGAYAADLIFGELWDHVVPNRLVRVCMIVIFLGVFSAIYTYVGGLAAVVRTDIIQFTILCIGGTVILISSLKVAGGWGVMRERVPELMHLHLPADHPKLPWTHIFGLFLLNINYWCANQSVIQRSLAAKSLRHAQIGLMAGGVMKYFMAVLIVVPGIALASILGTEGLTDPDEAFPTLVRNYLSDGFRGIILCALFASLMSTVDSMFNSLATLWSVDIYKEYLKPDASDSEMIRVARRTILVTLLTGTAMACYLVYTKLAAPEDAFTHTLNEMRYYVNCGIVILICTAAFVVVRQRWSVLLAFLLSIPSNLFIKAYLPEMNYFVRAMWVILIGFGIIALVQLISSTSGSSLATKSPSRPLGNSDPKVVFFGFCLVLSLITLHVLFH